MAKMSHMFNNYADARTLSVCGRQSKDGMVRLGNNTYLAVRPQIEGWPEYAVVLHDTDVVTFKHDGRIILNSGGFVTYTTADRMNAFTPLSVQVSIRGDMFVVHIDGFNVGTFKDTFTVYPPYAVL